MSAYIKGVGFRLWSDVATILKPCFWLVWHVHACEPIQKDNSGGGRCEVPTTGIQIYIYIYIYIFILSIEIIMMCY